jgi:hypothetical protein
MYVYNTGPVKVNGTSCAAPVRPQATSLTPRPTLRRHPRASS